MKHITRDMVRKEIKDLNTLLVGINSPIRNISGNYASQYGGWEISYFIEDQYHCFFYSRLSTPAAYYFLQGYSFSLLRHILLNK